MEHAAGIFGMTLGIAAGGHVENDSGMAFLSESGMGELDAELRFADAGGADDDGEPAGQESAAEEFVEAGDAGGEAGHEAGRNAEFGVGNVGVRK